MRTSEGQLSKANADAQAVKGGSKAVPPLLFAPYRLPVKAFDKVFQEGKSVVCGALVMRYVPNDCEITRVGVIAAKRTFHRAVERSRARRLMREAFRLERPRLKPGYDIVLLGRSKLLEMKCDAVRRSLFGICRKSQLIGGRS